MRLKLSALFLSTALATGLVAGTMLLTAPLAPVAQAQVASEVDVDSLLKLLPADKVKATYDSKSYDAVSGITTVKGLKLSDPARAENYAAIEEIGLRGVDVDAFGHVFDFSKYGTTPDETFKQLFGDVTIKNASIVNAGKTMASVESLALGGVQMKQLQNVQPGFAPGAGPKVEQNDANDLKFAGSLLDSLIAGKLDVTNLTVQGPDQKVSVARLSLDGYNRGQLGASEMDSFETDMANMGGGAGGGTSYAKIASTKSDGIDISKLLPWMMKAQMPPVTPDPLLYVGAGEASGIDYNIMGTKVTLASEKIDAISFYWLVPSSLKFAITDLMITFPQDGAPGMNPGSQLKELGVDHLDLDFALDWAFDGAAKTAQLRELTINESQLFDTKLSMDLVGIDLAALVGNAMAGAQTIGLAGAELDVKNNGGFDKILTLAAKEQNTTPDALKQQALTQLGQMEGGMPGPDGQTKPPTDRMKSILEALKAFIQSPGTLTVKVQPASPITAGTGMGAMMDPMGAADALGITVESTGQ